MPNIPDLGLVLAYDLETNGLLTSKGGIPAMDTVHSVAVTDLNDGDREYYYGPAVQQGHPKWTPLLGNPSGTVEEGIKHLMTADTILAHNGSNFDHRVIARFFPDIWATRKATLRPWDTYVAAKIIWPYDVLFGPDLVLARSGRMPMKLCKSHGLKAWGYRLGDNKDDYDGDHDKYPGDDPEVVKERFAKRWAEWNPWMASYMLQDNRPMVKLWRLILKRLGWDAENPPRDGFIWPELVFSYEHEAARIIAEQEEFGVRFDMEKARKLETLLRNLQAKNHRALEKTFGSWWQPGATCTPSISRSVKRDDLPHVVQRRVSDKTGKELAPYEGPPLERYSPDAPYTPIVRVSYNASSRQHLGLRLQDVYGWKPKAFGGKDKDIPTVDEGTLEEIPEAVLPADTKRLILDGFVIDKTLGMLAKGQGSWMNKAVEQPDGTWRIFGRVDPCGAITGRALHSSPNLGQCPSVIKAKVKQPDGTTKEEIQYGMEGRFGYDCRALFVSDVGWEQTGTDASSLELIDLGHYLVSFDDGVFSARVCDPSRDPHTEHSELTGQTRGDTKTTTYLYIYGGSAFKLSLSIEIEAHEVPDLLTYKGLPMLLRSLDKRMGDGFVAKMDDMQKAKLAKARTIIKAFEDNITGLKDLKESVTKAAERGYLKGMDGRKVIVRKAHAALNSLLQSAGAQTCKLWMVIFHQRMAQLGYVHGVHYKQTLWIHDELAITHIPGIGPEILEVSNKAIKEAGVMLGLKGEYRTDGRTAYDWAETH